ncbi:LOW QUALITY PROTEIN: hypothetical protein HID58_057291, partial [Brassica napus]
KPTFSGRFGRYILSTQLKVAKKHEAFFLFAGKPILPLIIAIVTCLNCCKYPANRKKRTKKHIKVLVSSVISMLKKKNVTGKEMKLKYAILAFLVSVILLTTHAPKTRPC